VNGQDVSAQLVLTGSDTSQSRNVTYYNGLQPNKAYAATYIVTDSGGLSTTNDISFDTFVEAQIKLIEAEEYNYGGQYIDDPPAGSYPGLSGTPNVDFQDTTPNTVGAYRVDAVDMAASTDLARNKYVSSGAVDYNIT